MSDSGGVDPEREEVVVDLPQDPPEGETPTNIDDVVVEGVSSQEQVEVMIVHGWLCAVVQSEANSVWDCVYT